MNNFDNTEEWKLYQIGLDYDTKIDYHNKTDLNWNMYNSKQWIGVVTNGLSKWTFNICKSAINYFIAFICSQKLKITYSAENLPDEPETLTDDMGKPVVDKMGQTMLTENGQAQLKIKEIVDLLSDMAEMKWEKEKMDTKIRRLLLNGAVTGDYYGYTYWDKNVKTGQAETGDFHTEITDGVNVMFGNPNNEEAEPQPYILIIRRSMVSDLKRRAKENGIEQSLIDTITSDLENTYQSGQYGKIELDSKDETGKALSILKLWKEEGTVYWNESTRFCPISKKIDLEITRYPLAKGNWESVNNCYRGMGAIDGIIDNQISINQMFAMISYWMKLNAYGKTIIDSTLITSWTNKIGEVIKANGPVGTDVVRQLEAGNFNAAVITVIDLAIKYTKEFIGASDTLMGQVDPEKASGIAIMNGGKQASIPLGSPSANRDQFVEDLGLIWGEFYLKKYKNRLVTIKRKGKVITVPFSTDGTGEVLLNCKVDVGPATIYSETTSVEELRSLLQSGNITKMQYFERMEGVGIIPDVQGLIDDEKELIERQQQLEKDAADAGKQFDKFLASLSPQLQQAIAQESQQQVAQQQMSQAPMQGGMQ